MTSELVVLLLQYSDASVKRAPFVTKWWDQSARFNYFRLGFNTAKVVIIGQYKKHEPFQALSYLEVCL